MSDEPSVPSDTARLPPLWLVASLAAVGPFSISLYLPALPALTRALDATAAEGQLTLTLYLAGFAIAQLVYGPVSDRVGRRPAMIVGLAVYVAASLVAAAATTLPMLLIARFVQALGACAGTVLSRALVRDVTNGPDIARTLAVVAAALTLSPALGPAIGGALSVWFGWRACFVLLAAAGAVLLASTLLALSETNRALVAEPLSPARLLSGYATLLGDRVFTRFLLVSAFITSATYVYNVGAPSIFISILGLPPDVFGLLGVVTAMGYLTGTLVVRRRVGSTTAGRLTLEGAVWSTVGATGLLVVATVGPLTVVSMIGTVIIYAVGLGLLYPTTAAAALERHPGTAGAAAALIGSAQVGCGMVATAILALSDSTSALPVAVLVLACSALALATASYHVSRPA